MRIPTPRKPARLTATSGEDASDEALAEVAEDGRPAQPQLIVGARGIGKTVLLGYVGDLAGSTYGWPRVHVELVADRPFTPKLAEWKIPAERVHVIPNWAPLQELPEQPRNNAWARAHDLVDTPVVLYAGTLGLKHDSKWLLIAAKAFPTKRFCVSSASVR